MRQILFLLIFLFASCASNNSKNGKEVMAEKKIKNRQNYAHRIFER